MYAIRSYYALAVHDVELDDLERRRDLVLDHLHPGLVADDVVPVLDPADPADIDPHAGAELQGVAAAIQVLRQAPGGQWLVLGDLAELGVITSYSIHYTKLYE